MPHVCASCGKTFTQSGSLNRHIASAHDNKVFECDICHRQLSSKCSLERHQRFQHRSDLVKNNRPDFTKVEYVPYVKKEGESSTSNSDSDDDTDNRESKQGLNNNDGIELKTNSNEVIESNEEKTDNKELEDMETANVSESDEDSAKPDDSEGEKYKLFDLIDTPEDMLRRFKICDKVVTFRVKPPTGKYTTWILELIYDLYDYFIRTYSHDENDSVGLKLICKNGYCEQEYNITPKVIKNLNFGEIVREVLQSPFSCCGELTVCYDHILKPNLPSQIMKKYGGRYKRLRYKPLIGGIMGRM